MLARKTFLYMPVQLLNPLLVFISAVVFTYWLTPVDYGLLMLVMALQELAFQITLSWWSHYVLRYEATSSEDERNQIIRTERGALLLGALAQIPLLIAIFAFMPRGTAVMIIALACIFVMTRSLLMHLGERARAEDDLFGYYVTSLSGPGLGFLFCLLVKMAGIVSVESLLAAFSAAQALALLFMLMRSAKKHAVSVAALDVINKPLIRRAFFYSGPLLISGILTWASAHGIRLIVDYLEGSEALGLLSVGWGLGQRLASVTAMLVTSAAFPLALRVMSTSGKQAGLEQIARNGTLLYAVLLPTTIGCFFITIPLVQLIVAKEFQQVTLWIMPMAMAIASIRNLRMHFPDQAFLLAEKTKGTLVVCFVDSMFVLTGCVLGILDGGLFHGVIGAFIGALMSTIYGFVLAIRKFGLPFPVLNFLKITIAGVIMAIVLHHFAAAFATFNHIPRLIALIGLGALVYGAALLAIYPRLSWHYWKKFKG